MEVNDLQIYIKDPTSADDFRFLQNEAEDMIRIGDPEECKELANYLGGILQEYAPQLQNQPQMYDLYQAYWHRLAFKAFINLPTNVKNDLIQRRLLFAVSKGFDPDTLIRKYFELLADPQSVKAAIALFQKPFEQNVEALGSNPLTIEDKKVLPQLKNWILDYSKFPSLNARRGSIDRLNYINQSPNARGLTQNQRQVLLKVLKFYDDLINPELTSLAPISEQPVAEATEKAVSAPTQSKVMQSQPSQATVAEVAPSPSKSPTQSFINSGTSSNSSPIDINQKLEELKNRKK